MAFMARKCTMRAASKSPISDVSQPSWTGFQIARPERTATIPARMTPEIEQLLNGVVGGEVVMAEPTRERSRRSAATAARETGSSLRRNRPAQDPVCEIGNPFAGEHPHRRECQRVAPPSSRRG